MGEKIGNEVGGGIRQIGDAVERHMAVMETSELYKTGTELRLNLQQRYDQESALPENRGDPHFGDRFMAEVGPLLDQWGNGAGTEHGKMLAATLKAGIRSDIFSHVAAGQSEMDAAHVHDNAVQTMNMLGAGLITDPSEANLTRTLGTAKDAIDGMTAAIPDVAMRERAASELAGQYLPQLVLSRYQVIGESIKNQIAETGAETSPALEQLNKDIAAQLGFDHLSPEEQARIPEIRDAAVRQGQELYSSKQNTAKAQLTDAGKAHYAKLHNVITNLALNGQGPTPELIDAASDYAKRYGATNPGEVASLDDFIMRGQERAQSNAVQPFDQKTRDDIQAGFAKPVGDPGRPTLASLTKAYSHGQITKEDLLGYTEILGKLDKPETDPGFKPAWESFVRWRDMQVQGIGGASSPGTGAARAAFIHDVTANFMARGKSGDWDKALNGITDIRVPGSFGKADMMAPYQKAAQRPDAANWLKDNWYQWNENGTATKAHGSTAAPVYPTGNTPQQPTKIDQATVDKIRGL